MIANEEGFQFYLSLFRDYASRRHRFAFRIADYNTRAFNEAVETPNAFRGINVDDEQ